MTAGLSRGVDAFKMQSGNQVRRIPMLCLSAVHKGGDEIGLPLPLDELCCVIELFTGECVCFKFGGKPEAEKFAISMRILLEESNKQRVHLSDAFEEKTEGGRLGPRKGLPRPSESFPQLKEMVRYILCPGGKIVSHPFETSSPIDLKREMPRF